MRWGETADTEADFKKICLTPSLRIWIFRVPRPVAICNTLSIEQLEKFVEAIGPR